eukprot:Skav235136  [mRNA]  locus=scaffold321:389203:390951:- [translate_table: standard]
MLDVLGLAAVIPAAGEAPGSVRTSRITQLFADAKLPIPFPKKGVTSPAALRVKQRRKTGGHLDPADFRINTEFLLNEDDTPTKQVHDLRRSSTGVMLTDLATALPWLREGARLSSDELGLIVLGQVTEEFPIKGQSVVLPCQGPQNHQVLVQGTLFQLGAKQLRVKAWEQDSVKATGSKVSSITLWQSDWDEQQWSQALSRTNHFIREILAREQLDHTLEGCWGRSLRRGKQVASTREATSIQVHISIAPKHFEEFLAASGFNRLWAVPKNHDGQLSDDFRVLWVPHLKQDISRITAIATQLSHMCGLVRGRSSMGIRIAKSSFVEAWKKLFPDIEVPADVASTMAYRIEPLPYGTNPGQLREWAGLVHWSFRPIRPLGPRAWLVGTAEKPPQSILSWNGQPVLLTYLPPRQVDRIQPVVGPRSAWESSKKPETNATGQGMLASDPWAAWIQNNSPVPPPSMAAPAPVTRTVQGPVEERFQGQDARIQSLEEKMAQLVDAQQQQTHHIQALDAKTGGMEQRLGAQLSQAVEAVKSELSGSFAIALTKQSQSFDDNLREIKALLTKTKRKQQEKKEDDDMSSS